MTIPQSIIDKIKEKYPDVIGLAWQQNVHAQRQAAIWGYGLSEERIKELEADIKRLEKIIEAIMRRVAAMAVCAMEQIETPKRCMVPNKEREFETSEVNKSEIF